MPGTGPATSRALGLHMNVDCLAFTGSTTTGKRFMEYSGQSNLKQVWLECGGKSPHVILDDCPDLDRAALAAAVGIFNNQGEVCIAGSRLYMHNATYDSFMEKADAWADKTQPGNPLDPSTLIGTIVNERQLARVMQYVKTGQSGRCTSARGRQTHTRRNRRLLRRTHHLRVRYPRIDHLKEEIFGPVLAATRFETEEEVVALTNRSDYGLGSGPWTANLSRAYRVPRQLCTGLVWVNRYFDGNVSVPFNGVKQSGFGHDKSLHALEKYTSIKSIWIKL